MLHPMLAPVEAAVGVDGPLGVLAEYSANEATLFHGPPNALLDLAGHTVLPPYACEPRLLLER